MEKGRAGAVRSNRSGKIEVLCAMRAPSLDRAPDNFGTQIAQIEDRVPRLSYPPHKNEKFLAHKLPKFEIVCHS
ncbi:MAG: hypothetical protein IKH41_00260, partial [Clostridia bacterium]|nr:hypothetical protein [Clostridia bacterium]